MPEKKSLNEKIADLDAEVEWFYSDDFRLEDATKNYKSAAILARDIEKDLENLKNEIEVLSKDFSR